MRAKLTKQMIDAIGAAKLKAYGVSEDEFRWKAELFVDLTELSPKQIQILVDLVKPHEKIKGSGVLLRDCAVWLRALSGETIRPRNVDQFEALLRKALLNTPGHRIYEKDDSRGIWQAFYVNKTEFVPAQKRRDDYIPAHANLELVWTEFGGRHKAHETFWPEDCIGKTVEESLAKKGYIMETPEMREEYLRRRALFHEYSGKIGKQFLARGIATDDVDGNRDGGEDRWYYRSTKTIQLDKDNEPARVVADVFFESDKDRRDSDVSVYRTWWETHGKITERDSDAEEEDADLSEIPEPEIPLHPMLACFDMRRHLRLRIDVGQMTPYVYDPHLGDKLILPEDSRNLVEMLLAHKGGFKDIVVGKSGGSIILCAGIPGTGKTLTAEVYAEVMAKPLYTVQASQLGTNPDALEGELLKTFARSSRWGAILLLDEADVYVASRGSDLQQNAIVGVFLRVLEYYKGVLFLTTNRSDLVDDAIASRCVARIDYKAPIPTDLKRIWEVLSSTAGVYIAPEVIDQAAEMFPGLSGRDVKNLLKLAKLVSDSRECPITIEVLRFVKRFKPTWDIDAQGNRVQSEDGDPIKLPPMPERSMEPEPEPEEEEVQAVPEPAPVVEGEPPPTPPKDWRSIVDELFEDGAPHASSEAKENVAKVATGVHPNVVTNYLTSLTRAGKITRLGSGLYRKV